MPQRGDQRPASYIKAMTEAFRQSLERLVARAQARTLTDLRESLQLDNAGRIRVTPANQRVLRRVAARFMDNLGEMGVDRLIRAFVGSYPNSLPVFQETLATVSKQAPLRPIAWRPSDERALLAVQGSSEKVIRSAVEVAAKNAEREALLAIGGHPFRTLAEILAERFQETLGRAETLARSSMATYYRTLNARGIERIEEELPSDLEPMYGYLGPYDKLTRPFCRKLLDADDEYTRGEVEAMDNGQLPNPLLTGGGYNCRHTWGVVRLRARRRAA
jgi:hypothetical protein